MIVRILGTGQYELPADATAELDRADDLAVTALEAGDEPAFRRQLAAIVDLVRTMGSVLPDDYLGPSDLVLPGPDASLAEVRRLLAPEAQLPE